MFNKTCPAVRPITLDELQLELAGGDVVLVDALPAAVYRSAHLPGALNMRSRQARRPAPIYLPDKLVSGPLTNANLMRSRCETLRAMR